MKKMLGSALTEESLGWRLSFESSIANTKEFRRVHGLKLENWLA
jgi:hypothetical protein